MTERKPRSSSKKRASLGFVLMLLLSSLGALATVPAASAALPGSIGITDSISPLPNAWYSSFDTIEFEAEVTNYYAAPFRSITHPDMVCLRRRYNNATMQVGIR